MPQGLAAKKVWTRDKFKGINALKQKINPTRVPIEQNRKRPLAGGSERSTKLLDDPVRCAHIGDRESDIYELFCTAQDSRTHFLLRTGVDRVAGDGGNTIADEMAGVRCKGLHRMEMRDRRGNVCEAVLELKSARSPIVSPDKH